MAKKRAGEKKDMQATAEPEIVKPVRLDMPLSMHKRLSIEAGYEGVSMVALARLIVAEGLEARRIAREGK